MMSLIKIEKPELALWDVPAVQTEIEGSIFYDIGQLTTSISHTAPLEFLISTSPQEYVDLSQTYLSCQAQIVNSDGTALNDEVKVAPTNNTIHSMFGQVDIYLDEELISSATQTYPYRAIMEKMFNYSDEAKKSLLRMSMYYEDDDGKVDVIDPTLTTDNGGNSGLIKRFKRSKGSKTFEMADVLHIDLAHQHHLVLGKVSIRIKLHRNRDNFCILSGVENAAFKLNLVDAKLYVKKVLVSPATVEKHDKNFIEKGPATYYINQVLLKAYAIEQGTRFANLENLYMGQTPRKIIIAMVRGDAFNGDYKQNPFAFDHFNVNSVQLYVGGKPFPLKPLTPDFEKELYLDSYLSLFTGSGRWHEHTGIGGITYEGYPQKKTFFMLDLTPDNSTINDSIVPDSPVRLELRFAKPLGTNIVLLSYAELSSYFNITRYRKIIFSRRQ